MFILLILLLISCLYKVEPAKCSPKSDGSGKLVCVCNSTYCDDFPQVTTIPTGTAVVITSSQDGLRFAQTQIPFTPKDTGLFDFLTQLTMTVDSSQQYQEIIGFGGAFTDSAGINLASLSPGSQNNLVDAYFSHQGLEYTVGRVPIASTDFSTRIYSYDDISGDFALNNFQLAYEDLQYKIPFIKRALNLTGNKLQLFASACSAPDSSKKEYSKNGVNFWGLTSQNEPTSGYVPFYPWQTMGFTSETQRDFIKNYLGPALKADNVTKDLKLMILDDNRAFLVFPLLPYWADTPRQENLRHYSAANQYVHGTAVHWYSNKQSPAIVLTKTYQNHPDKFILATEACTGTDSGNKGPSMGDWSRAEEYADDIITDLNNFVAGWTDWNLCLNTECGPTWVPNFVDSPIIVNATADEFYKQPMFYAMGHFSKFMRPGSHRINVSASNLLGVSATATVDSLGRRVLTILNKGIIDVDIEVVDATKIQSTLKLTVDAHSIVTVLWN